MHFYHCLGGGINVQYFHAEVSAIEKHTFYFSKKIKDMTKCFYLIDSSKGAAYVANFTDSQITVDTSASGQVNIQVIEFI